MATRLNRYYNNPMIGAAFENIASMFAPPSAQEIAGYAQAEKARKEAEGLDTLYRMAGADNPDTAAFDRWGAVTGQWNPNQGFGARDMANSATLRGQDIASGDRRYGVDVGASTARRGQDISAETARSGNLLTNQTRAITDLFGPLSQGQVRPSVDEEIMGVLGLPGIGGVEGAPKPLSETEVQGQLLLDAISGGMVGPEDAAMAYRSDIPVEQIVGEAGPEFAYRGNVEGQEPFINPGSAPAKRFDTWATPDGRSGIAVMDPATGTAIDHATGQPLPPDAALDPSGAAAAEMTTGTSSEVQGRALAITGGLETLGRLEKLIAENPSSQGLVGVIRGTAQDAIRAGSEVGMLMGATMQEATAAATADPSLQGIVSELYDPNIPAIEMLTNVLAWQYAKSFAGARVSNEQLRIAKEAIGSGRVFANQQSSLARMREMRNLFQTEGARIAPMLPPELAQGLQPLLTVPSPGVPQATPSARPRAVNPETGETVEFDGEAWRPVTE